MDSKVNVLQTRLNKTTEEYYTKITNLRQNLIEADNDINYKVGKHLLAFPKRARDWDQVKKNTVIGKITLS
jgi:hypothetical protein